MVFSARSKRCAIWRACLWPVTAENSTSRTRSAVPLMMKKNGTISMPSTTSGASPRMISPSEIGATKVRAKIVTMRGEP